MDSVSTNGSQICELADLQIKHHSEIFCVLNVQKSAEIFISKALICMYFYYCASYTGNVNSEFVACFTL